MNSISNIKIIVVGECLSGKTCLINRYLTDSFEPSPLNVVKNLNILMFFIIFHLVLWC